MTVVCVHARSHVPTLALVQFSSAGFSEKKKIIAPVIMVWERFSVAENHKCHNHQPPSLQPISCFSTESLVVNKLRDLTCDYTWVFARETFPAYEHKEALLLFLLVCLLWLSFSPISALCLLHLITSQRSTRPRRTRQTDPFKLPTGRLCRRRASASMLG